MKASERQVGGDHYKDFEIQPSEFIHRNKLGFLEGNIIKYVCRHNRKNGRKDLEKAMHYLELIMEWAYGDVPSIPEGLTVHVDATRLDEPLPEYHLRRYV